MRWGKMTKIPIDQWDQEVKPLLQKIALNCGWIIHYARGIEDAARAMMIRPSFDTNARASLEEAVDSLKYALEKIDAAKTEYDRKEPEDGK
jgi:hypothetical protein